VARGISTSEARQSTQGPTAASQMQDMAAVSRTLDTTLRLVVPVDLVVLGDVLLVVLRPEL
jgi:hypothetical protein